MLTAVQRSDRRLRHVGVRSLLASLLRYWSFTGTKVQVLLKARRRCRHWYSVYWLSLCFTGTKVQILTQKDGRAAVTAQRLAWEMMKD
jgi:hypothetical protein